MTTTTGRTNLGPVRGRSAADVAALIRRPRESVELVLDAELADRLEQAKTRFERAKSRPEWEQNEAVQLAEQIRQLEEQAEACTQTFTFQAMSDRAYDELLARFPPTDEQYANARAAAERSGQPYQDPEIDEKQFAPALCAALAVEPAGTPDEWDALWAELSSGQVAVLFMTALAAQKKVTRLGPKFDTD
ncbi:hypothetical protein ACPCTH_33505 [Streptomyces cellulosae]